jgi:hypothetical protein
VVRSAADTAVGVAEAVGQKKVGCTGAERGIVGKPTNWTFALVVHGKPPTRTPLSRIAEYMQEFAALLGNRQDVLFAGVRKGSTVLRVQADEQDATELSKRIIGLRSGDAPKDATDRASRIDRMLGEDRTRAEIIRRDGNVLYAFQGTRPSTQGAAEITVSQEGELTGVVLRIGGRDDTVPLLLVDADKRYYEVNVRGRELAKEIAVHLFGNPVRVFGNGTWLRDAEGLWSIRHFLVNRFEALDDREASQILAELRSIPGNDWVTEEDPMAAWRELRGIS